MADRLARHGLPSHVFCALCDDQPEMLDHISLMSPDASSVWGVAMAGANVHLPLSSEGIGEWWTQAVLTLPANRRNDANSLIMLVLRALWLERNARVFDAKATPSRLRSILDTWTSWAVC
jgi:hypothetical protein